jgi:Fur family ferric uptake transcriptional regulator
MAKLSSVYRKLEEGSKRLTPQRERIITVFLDSPGRRFSAEEVHQMVRRQVRDIGMATVYRTLELLTQLEILQKTRSQEGRAQYEIHLGGVDAQHHLVCMRCGRVEEFQDDLLDQVERRLFQERGFRVADHDLKFYGTCAPCNGKEGSEHDDILRV